MSCIPDELANAEGTGKAGEKHSPVRQDLSRGELGRRTHGESGMTRRSSCRRLLHVAVTKTAAHLPFRD